MTYSETYGIVIMTLFSFERYLFVVYYQKVRFNLNDTGPNLQRHTLRFSLFSFLRFNKMCDCSCAWSTLKHNGATATRVDKCCLKFAEESTKNEHSAFLFLTLCPGGHQNGHLETPKWHLVTKLYYGSLEL